VVLAGQSNATGRGLYGRWAYPSPHYASRVFQVTRSYINGKPNLYHFITPAEFQIATAVEPLDNDDEIARVENPTRIGFAYAFSQLLAAHATDAARCVVIVPAARGGTSVLDWNLIPHQFVGDLTFFYLDMIHRTRLALSLLPNSRVAAFLWQQGEEDSDILASLDTPTPSRLDELMPNAATYQADLASVMAQMRHDLGCGFPLLMGQMAPSFISDYSTDPTFQAYAEAAKAAVTAAIQQVAATEPCAQGQFVSSDGLLTNGQEPDAPPLPHPDVTHFSATSQIALAVRYYAAYSTVTGK
jgi:hypothetical protein